MLISSAHLVVAEELIVTTENVETFPLKPLTSDMSTTASIEKLLTLLSADRVSSQTLNQIDNLVETIINTQIEQNQFINADITFKDINTLKKIFKKKLINVYHIRVEYPR